MKRTASIAAVAAGLLAALLSAVGPVNAAEGTTGLETGCNEYLVQGTSKHESDDSTPTYKNMHVSPMYGKCNTHDVAE